MHGIIYKSGNNIYTKPYIELIKEIINSDDPDLLRNFILTIGIVSNHGNWFTSENYNKELKILAQSYDWLLFLSDAGLAEFITELLLSPKQKFEPARNAFLASYSAHKKKNSFTKIQMNYEADQALQLYFRENSYKIEQWFNIISPRNSSLHEIRSQLLNLQNKNWRFIHSI